LHDLAECESIEVVTLINMTALEGQHLSAFKRMPRLKSLVLNSCIRLTDESLQKVDLPASVTELRVVHSPVGDESLIRWLGQTRLQTLMLNAPITRKIAPALAEQTDLVVLSITNAPLVDADLRFLGKCPLFNLSLTAMPVDGSFLRGFRDRSKVDFVTLGGTLLTDENAVQLRRLSKLGFVDLSWNPIKGEFLSDEKWPMVGRLDFQGTRFSETGKALLAKMTTPAHITYPSNWSALDLKRHGAVGPPAYFALNYLYLEEAKANAINVPVYYPPDFQLPKIDRCPAELMGPLMELLEMAKLEAAECERMQSQE
jgi:hypothetical protein